MKLRLPSLGTYFEFSICFQLTPTYRNELQAGILWQMYLKFEELLVYPQFP